MTNEGALVPGNVERIVPMLADHAELVLQIYQAGMDSGDATFETSAPGWAEFDRRYLAEHRFVGLGADGGVMGWVAASPVSSRCAYQGVIEHSIYVAASCRGRAVGSALLRRLIDSATSGGVWTIQTGIFPENHASLAVHHKAGFRTVGVRERIGQRDGQWRDVVLLERRVPAEEIPR